ncbi:MAG: hypothetical protein KBT53_03045 [Porticoccus sp.]|nr:hypothetical protein [Porticoccus sp.]MBQ0807449.1 hypothetical protein [Porticoccus sp.]
MKLKHTWIFIILLLAWFYRPSSLVHMPDDENVDKIFLLNLSTGEFTPMDEWYWGKGDDYFFSTQFHSEDACVSSSLEYKVIGAYRIVRKGVRGFKEPYSDLYLLRGLGNNPDCRLFISHIMFAYYEQRSEKR